MKAALQGLAALVALLAGLGVPASAAAAAVSAPEAPPASAAAAEPVAGAAAPAAATAAAATAARPLGTPEPAHSPATPTAAGRGLASLRWAVLRSVLPPEAPDAFSTARFTLQAGAGGLPASGWALHFTCIAGVQTGATGGPFVLEQLVGTLYRLRPTAGFAGLAAGQSLDLDFAHPELMFKADKAPQGPYLVFDDQPDQGFAITPYTLQTPSRPEQLARPAGAPPAQVSPLEIFEANARIQPVHAAALPPVFPTPQSLQQRAGLLRWQQMPLISAPPALQAQATQAAAWLRPHLAEGAGKADSAVTGAGPAARPVRAGPRTPPLRLRTGPLPGLASPEAYVLDIHPQRGITLTGASAAGVAHGLQSLRDLLPLQPAPAAGLELPALRLRDQPRFEHRGLLLDVARNFHGKDTVLRVLDLMARLKLNKLHFHLTDDEGWRLAIRGLPELTEVGGRRGHSADPLRHLPPAYGSGPDVANADGSGHYTAEDYIEILRHAAARHIEVIPEIEMPGHARAAVVAMQARARRLAAAGDPQADAWLLRDPQDRSVYRSAQLYTDNVMDPGLPSTYRFIEHVVAEVVRLHREAGVPLRQLHVGADETPAGAWAKSPAAMATLQREGLAGLPGLWNHFYDRVGEILRRHGLAAGGWEELGARRANADGSGPLVPNAHFLGRGHTLYVWNNLGDADDLAYRLANAGYRTVLTPATTLYFDMAANRDPAEPGVNWAAYADLDTVFDFVPLDMLRRQPSQPGAAGKTTLTPKGRRRIAGIQGTLFAETLRGAQRLEFALLPRVFALAERAWAADPAWARETDPTRAQALHARAWSEFVHQAGHQLLPRLERDLPGLRGRMAPPGLKLVGEFVHVNHQLPGLTLRFTTDGQDPTTQSPVVTGPLRAGGELRAAAFDATGRRGAVSVIITP